MKAKILLLASVVFCCFVTMCPSVFAQGTAFTYQGQLTGSGSPVHGTYDLTFKLWNASSGGAQVGSTFTVPGVVITNGLFTSVLDFGNVFEHITTQVITLAPPLWGGSPTRAGRPRPAAASGN